ncbi:MAG: hypothetical protein LBN26_04175 [Christensenellaceae bacterium]|nr:hypothetical protein [Christensenellaceae bacterium]
MTLREAILDALSDDGESIKQICEYLEFLNIFATKEAVAKLLDTLWKENKITIVYPPLGVVESLLVENINDFWFEMTDEGRGEWEAIEI